LDAIDCPFGLRGPIKDLRDLDPPCPNNSWLVICGRSGGIPDQSRVTCLPCPAYLIKINDIKCRSKIAAVF
jgi:hypothetical protein